MAMNGTKSVVLNLLGNNSKALAAIKEVQEAEDELKAQSDDELVIGGDTAEAQEQIDRLTEAVQRYSDASREAASATGRVSDLEDEGSDQSAEYAAAQQRATVATRELRDAQLELGQAQAECGDEAAIAASKQDEAAIAARDAGDDAEAARGKWALAALGVAAVGAISVDMAAKFQEASTLLVTGAGESAKNLAMVKSGMLQLSDQTGISADDIAKGMFLVESAGYHGADGLAVMAAAAKGAVAGGADVSDVANVLTSAMNAYHAPASDAAEITGQLLQIVSRGKMTFEQLATSMSNVLPIAASAHISLAQVGGAIATMTAQGMTSRRATMNLANMIRSLVAPSSDAAAEMKNLGLSSSKISTDLGREGLTGTLSTLTEAILRNSKGGQVLAASFAQMTPQTQAYARAILAGKLSGDEFTQATETLSTKQAALLTQFNTTATGATGVKETFDSAMKTMVGGATGLNVALLLGGSHMKTFEANVKSVGEAGKSGAALQERFNAAEDDFDNVMKRVLSSVENVGIEIGSVMLPALSAVGKVLANVLGWLFKVPGLAQGLGILVAVFGGAALAVKAWGLATEFASKMQELFNAVLEMNPFVLIISLVVILAVVIYELVKHCKVFRDFWKDVWRDATHWIADAFDWVKHNWPLLLGILLGPIALAVALIITHWHRLEDGAKDVWHFVTYWFGRIWHDITHMFADAGEWLYNAGKAVVEGLIHGVEDMIGDAIQSVKNLGSDITGAFKSVLGIFSPSRIFRSHGQDIVKGLILGIGDEHSYAVNAISKLGSDIAAAGTRSIRGGLSGPGGYGSAGATVINFNGIVTDPDAVARKIQQMLLDYKRHNGNRLLGLS